MKHKKTYVECLPLKFILESQDINTCFGCGSKIECNDSYFHHGDSIILCPKCAVLAKMKNGPIRKNEFDCNMANAHKKNWKSISSGRNLCEILKAAFPDTPKIDLIKENNSNED